MKVTLSAFVLFVFVVLLVCFYSSQQFLTSSIATPFVLRKRHSFLCLRSNCSLHECFQPFMDLLKGCSPSSTYCFLEPRPAIPIEAVNEACQRHLIPKPRPSFLSKETIRCYSRRIITGRRRVRARRGLSVVKALFAKNKIPLIVAGGTLLGSLRYHGVIPYDDDFDFRIPSDQARKAKSVLAELCRRDPRFRCDLTLTKMDHYQVHIGITKKGSSASFIDFFFFSIKGSYIYWPETGRNYNKSIVFPTIKRPLEGQLFDFPRDPQSYQDILYKAYHPKECHAYDHYRLERKGCRRVRCSDLNSFLPFLVAAESGGGRLELVVDKAHVRSLFWRRSDENLA